MPLTLRIVAGFFLAILPLASVSETVTQDGHEFVVVYNTNSTINSFQQRQLRSIFTLKQSIWPDGSKIQLVTLRRDHDTHKRFLEDRLKLFPYQVQRIWDRQIFSGSARPPTETQNFESLIKIIAGTEGSIGYIKRSDLKAFNNDQISVATIN